MQLKLFKYEGAGNDFLAIDARRVSLPGGGALTALVRAICDRRRGIGADGVLILHDPGSDGSDFRMEYLNSDGSIGEMCGNGARCIARFAHLMGAAGADMTFETGAGIYSACFNDAGVRLAIPDIAGQPKHATLHALGRDWDTDFLVVGVPHAVVWVEDLERLDVNVFGRALRQHEYFAPRGANVNFAQKAAGGGHDIDVRTYERGVEEETLACGTGSVAASVCYAIREKRRGRTEVRALPTGKQGLSIGFTLNDNSITDVSLSGPARLVFTTVVTWDEAKSELRPFDFEMAMR